MVSITTILKQNKEMGMQYHPIYLVTERTLTEYKKQNSHVIKNGGQISAPGVLIR